MNAVTPTKLKVTKHFANAAEIKCLKTNDLIEIHIPLDPILIEGEYTFSNGRFVIWSKGKFAKITKKIKECDDCKICNCDKS
ncbi:hypothetical protein [Flavobacterium psychrophilum]|uniref:Uncharacterized protein n=1 Tax=Flavobacterium psychrophilum TaxID=96345 RepID=A0A7U2NED8_FLAPS|nr:hypothetical protein [Flavobacterium psychrophilum]QRE03495.1 hypothetical protein H0H26_11480 [Flavobacterium psychrophilum]